LWQKIGLEGIVSKRLGSTYRSGRSRHWIKSKNPAAPAVKREEEEDWGRGRWHVHCRVQNGRRRGAGDLALGEFATSAAAQGYSVEGKRWAP
jgi:ATP-dependent DNA ligase